MADDSIGQPTAASESSDSSRQRTRSSMTRRKMLKNLSIGGAGLALAAGTATPAAAEEQNRRRQEWQNKMLFRKVLEEVFNQQTSSYETLLGKGLLAEHRSV